MADGSDKPIEDVDVGDKVLATDPETGETSAEPVLDTITSNGDKNFVQITVDTQAPALAWMIGAEAKPKPVSLITPKVANSGLVIATDHHPFWVAGDINAWTNAGDLKPGMWLRTSVGTYVQVTATKHWTARHQRTHNLTIANLHTYYVAAGTATVLVHNASSCVSWEWNSKVTFGHTFERHGAGPKNANRLRGRVQQKGPQGQWLDNEAAAKFLRGTHVPNSGVYAVRLPDGLGQVIMADGSVRPAKYAYIVPGNNGLIKTAYPTLGYPFDRRTGGFGN